MIRDAVIQAHRPGRYRGESWLLKQGLATILRFHHWDGLPEHQTASNTSNTTKGYKRSAAKCPLPLPTDVIRLPGHALRNVGVGACTSEEDTSILGPDVGGPAHHGQANDCEDGITDDDRTADVEAITDPGGSEHHDACEGVCYCVSPVVVKKRECNAMTYKGERQDTEQHPR